MRSGRWAKTIPSEENVYNWRGTIISLPAVKSIKPQDLTIVDLFSGAGGFSKGFEWAGFQTILGVDIHRPSADTFHYNHPGSAFLLGDMREISDNQLVDALGGISPHVVVAGVPCQGFSLCNRKRHDEDRRNFLFMEFVRTVTVLRPPIVLLENVSGILSSRKGTFAQSIKKSIENLGYKVECIMLNAADYGVPQFRRRIFFLGVRPDYEIWWPAPTHGWRKLPNVTVGDAIDDLPKLKSGQSSQEYNAPPRTQYQQLMRGENSNLRNHEAPNHPENTIKKLRATVPGQPIYPKFTQRIRLDSGKPSPTQVSGGIRPQFQFGHPSQARGLTIRERARIQSFPDSYFFCGGLVQGRVQTGNAVPPLLAKAIADEIRNILNGTPPKDRILQETSRQLEFAGV